MVKEDLSMSVLTLPKKEKEVGLLPLSTLLLLFFFFGLFRALATAYGGSQARGPIGPAAAGLRHCHSNVGCEPHL